MKIIEPKVELINSPAAHPDMRVVAHRLLDIFKARYPVFFEDIEV